MCENIAIKESASLKWLVVLSVADKMFPNGSMKVRQNGFVEDLLDREPQSKVLKKRDIWRNVIVRNGCDLLHNNLP